MSHRDGQYYVNRRQWLAISGTAALALAGPGIRAGAAAESTQEPEVPAAEDLMREHGILRRVLLVYSEAATRLTNDDAELPAAELGRAAALFRRFGEDYHERVLEEKHVFPLLIDQGGERAALAQTLTDQHERGREINAYVSFVTADGAVSPADRAPLAGALVGFVRMYQHHAAIEDTVAFPEWKKLVTPSQYSELSEQFEDLEHRMLGEDAFEEAVREISVIEAAFGLADLSALTAPLPPQPA
jgi:hemerythrin-like domain-containing protein